MERDPLRFIWRTAPTLHIGALMLLALALPLAWIGLDLVRSAIDDAISGRAFTDGASMASLLRYTLPLPDRIAEKPIVLFPGIPLGQAAFIPAMAGGLATVAFAISLVALLFGLVRVIIGGRATATLVAQSSRASRPRGHRRA